MEITPVVAPADTENSRSIIPPTQDTPCAIVVSLGSPYIDRVYDDDHHDFQPVFVVPFTGDGKAAWTRAVKQALCEEYTANRRASDMRYWSERCAPYVAFFEKVMALPEVDIGCLCRDFHVLCDDDDDEPIPDTAVLSGVLREWRDVWPPRCEYAGSYAAHIRFVKMA